MAGWKSWPALGVWLWLVMVKARTTTAPRSKVRIPCIVSEACVVPTRNLVRVESIDVGPVPLVSSHPYARSVCFRFCDPLFLLPDSGGLAIRDPRSSPPDQRAAEIAAWACSPEGSRPVVLDLAYAPLVRLALCPGHRQAGDGGRLASQAPRIHGELLKLGIALSQATVAKYVVHTRRPPSQSWRAFLNNHVDQLCLDHVIVMNEASLRRTFRSYLHYYQGSRTHLSLGEDSPEERVVQPPELGAVIEIAQVGGLHHRYERRAA